ncbi:MAG TPA: mercuric reductase [Polyangia bacterium]|nr:mercuric reductase [Polyangia bacterium]
MSTARPDVIVIGTGQAGVPLATRLAAAGRKVAIIERGALGGTCTNVGCTPTKTMIASARAAHVARTAGRLGVSVGPVEVDFHAVMARKERIVERWRAGVERRLAQAAERVRLVRGHARFVGPRIVEVNGERLEANRIVLDVGARPAWPELPGLRDVGAFDSAAALASRDLPPRLLVLGAGYVACELGQMFRRLGAEVTLVAPSPRPLSREDEDVSSALAGALVADGVALELGAAVTAARRAGQEIELDRAGGRATLRGSHLLVATGRRPNTDDLGCEAGGVALDASGHVAVDERYETSQPGVFAVGDCVPGPQFTHVSWDDHRVLFSILTGRPARARTARHVPFTVFTDPQVAGIGLSEREARERGLPVEVATMPFGNIARAIETDETAGLVKILVDPASERIVGARVVGAEAGELIHVLGVLMQAGASVRALVDGEIAHPTFAEGLQSAVMKLPRFALA